MARILHVITNLKQGGAEKLMVDLLPLLQEKGNLVSLLLFDGLETPFKNELENTDVNIFELADSGGDSSHWAVYNPLNICRLLKCIRRYDIIHTHNSVCQLYIPIAKLLSRSNVKLVTTEHSSSNRRRSKRWFRPIDRWMYNQYDAIICIANQTRNNLEDYIGFKPTINTIFNGINTNKYLNPIEDISLKTSFIITMVAAFRDEKDHGTVLRSLLHLPSYYSLQLVGRGLTETRNKTLCKELGLERRVSFMGMRSDVPSILAKSDVIVLSSHWEGLSLSSIEGMASGRPFVASDVDGLHEIVEGAGVLFPHGDDEALARAIKELCENPDYYKSVAKACQERAKQYDISVMAEKYHELYESLMSKSANS